MWLVATKTTADGIDALTGLLQGLTLMRTLPMSTPRAGSAWKLESHRCPRGFAPFVTRMGFLNRQDGTYQGTFEESTLLIVKAGSVSAGDRMFVCAAGFAKDSPLNDGTTTACVGALIHEALTRVLALESDVRRTAALMPASLLTTISWLFDVEGRLLDRHPGGSQIALPPSLFQTAVSSAARRRLKPTQPAALQFEGRTYNVRSRWIASPLLDCRYLLVHVRARPAAPLVVERLKHYGLSRRESQSRNWCLSGKPTRSSPRRCSSAAIR